MEPSLVERKELLLELWFAYDSQIKLCACLRMLNEVNNLLDSLVGVAAFVLGCEMSDLDEALV